jgi:FkbM family methyltransferase
MNIDKNTCWYKDESIKEMNRFYETYRGNQEILKHMDTVTQLLEDTNLEGVDLLDLGCGTAMLSEYAKKFNYYGADLPNVLNYSSMLFYPQYYYKATELDVDNLLWINKYPVVVLNAVIDVMEYPLEILDKVLKNASEYVVIHRQEITLEGQTRVIKNGSYGDITYHSIINKYDLDLICDKNDFDIVRNYNLYFTNWENDGNSLLLRKREKWSLYDISSKLYQKYFLGKQNLKFFEAGANDGITQSNTMYFEFYKNWSGILVEPSLEPFQKLIENRSSRNQYFNCALVSPDYESETIEMIYTPENKGMLSVINDENAEKQLFKCRNEKQIKQDVKARTLNSVLDECLNEGDVINLMILDLEGYEVNALKNVNFKKHNIEYILVEELQESDVIKDLLSEYYDRIDKITEHDYLYKRKIC